MTKIRIRTSLMSKIEQMFLHCIGFVVVVFLFSTRNYIYKCIYITTRKTNFTVPCSLQKKPTKLKTKKETKVTVKEIVHEHSSENKT